MIVCIPRCRTTTLVPLELQRDGTKYRRFYPTSPKCEIYEDRFKDLQHGPSGQTEIRSKLRTSGTTSATSSQASPLDRMDRLEGPRKEGQGPHGSVLTWDLPLSALMVASSVPPKPWLNPTAISGHTIVRLLGFDIACTHAETYSGECITAWLGRDRVPSMANPDGVCI